MSLHPVFRYPDKRHRRRLKPGPFANYRSYKPYLREEFFRRCVYCRLPDELKGNDGFGVDHYRPQRKFKFLRAEYSNLFYCCNSCNAKKGAFWPSRAEYDRRWLIPNPCHNRMSAHLWYKDEEIFATTASGKCAVEILRLNAPEAVHLRRSYAETVRSVRENRNSIGRRIDDARRSLVREKSPTRRAALEKFLLDGETRVTELRMFLEDLVPPEL